MFVFNERLDQLIISNSVHWYDHVLRIENGHVPRRALEFEVEGMVNNGWLKRTCKKQVEDKSM